MSNRNIPFSASAKSGATASTPINPQSSRNSRGSYTNPTATKQLNDSTKGPPPKMKKPKRIKRHRHSYQYNRLISPHETDNEEDDEIEDDEVEFLDETVIKKLPKLTPEEEIFFDLVKSGNVSDVSDMYDELQSCELMRTLNFQGHTVLHIAAEQQNEEMVELLCHKFGHCVEGYILIDVLLHAIHEGNVDIVQQLLVIIKSRGISLQPAYVQPSEAVISVKRPPQDQQRFPNSNFTDDMTPFCLAAQGENYEIMSIFYEMGLRIIQPADHCKCTDTDCAKYSDIAFAIKHLNISRAIYNPAYKCFLAFKEPGRDIMTEAFNDIEELEECIKNMKHFTSAYQDLLDELKKFTCDLLGQCRDADEVHQFLGTHSGYDGEDYGFPRLSKALDMQHKEFVAHPHSQMVLFGLWIEGWPGWAKYGTAARIAIFFVRLLFAIPYLLVSFAYGCFVQEGFLAAPVNRFLNTVVAEIYFLALVFLVNTTNRKPGDRGPPHWFFQIAIPAFFVGHVVSIVRQFSTDVKSVFLLSPWFWMDVMTQASFFGAFICWFLAGRQDSKYDIPRKWWPNDEPILIAEIFFATASIMAYSKLIRLLQLDYRIGPLITAMGEMARDIFDVLVFIAILIFSFATGLYYMYLTYDGLEGTDEHGNTVHQGGALTTYVSALDTLFYALFSMSGSDAPNIVGQNVSYGNESAINRHYFTQTTGKSIYAAFHIIASMMAMTVVSGLVISHYDRIKDNVDTEWKFVRGQLWMSFVKGTFSPSPFNSFPTGPCCCRRVCNRIGCCKRSQDKLDEEKQNVKVKPMDYPELLQQLIQRYIRDKAEIEEAERADSEIINSLKEDLQELRSAMDKTERMLMRQNETGFLEVQDLRAFDTVPENTKDVGRKPNVVRKPQVDPFGGSAVSPTKTTSLPRIASDTSAQPRSTPGRLQPTLTPLRPPPMPPATPSRSQIPQTPSKSQIRQTQSRPIPATTAPSSSSGAGRPPIPPTASTTRGKPPVPPPLPSASESGTSVATGSTVSPSTAQGQPSTDASVSLPATRKGNAPGKK